MTTGDVMLDAIAMLDPARRALAEKGFEIQHVAWLGPYGIVPGGIDVDPVEGWLPVFVARPVPIEPDPDVLAAPTGERLTLSPSELMPYDQLGDGRFISDLHGGIVQGRWTQMTVGQVACTQSIVMLPGGPACLWQYVWSDQVKIPVPPSLEIVRDARPPGYTCTAPGNPDECASCPARS